MGPVSSSAFDANSLGEPRPPAPPLGLDDEPDVILLFTVDTECSILRQPDPDPARVIDELIFGDFGAGEANGIGLHMDLLEHFGFRGSFFVDVLIEYEYGREALERTVEAIAARGHEVQLHVHARRLRWSPDPSIASLADALSSPDPDTFRRLMELSVALFERRVGVPPLAYRAGGYRIADTHFAVLEEFGIRIDSSINTLARSSVADWARIRTQPFRIGGVLEVPPTLLLLDDGDSLQTRGFFPNSSVPEPLAAMGRWSGAAPEVATYVSHSFQLLQSRRETGAAAVAALNDRIRGVVPPEDADRFVQPMARQVVAYGEEADPGRAAAVADLLRSAADRPGARCATCTELDAVRDRFWAEECHPTVDPIPLLNRRGRPAASAATRVLGRELLSHLSDRPVERPSRRPATPGTRVGLNDLARLSAPDLCDELAKAVTAVGPGNTLTVGLSTLGVASPAERLDQLPLLAELVFPRGAVLAVSRDAGVEPPELLPWDGATFEAWLTDQGFEIVSMRRLARSPDELSAANRFAAKLGWIDHQELATAAVELDLRSTIPRPERDTPGPFLLARKSADGEASFAIGERCEPEALPSVAARLCEAAQPAHSVTLRVPPEPWPATRSSILLSAMRAGLEIVDARDSGEGVEYRLVWPLELADLRRFAGLP